jgi:hypothetical protein
MITVQADATIRSGLNYQLLAEIYFAPQIADGW